jgi:hypothetical protein
VDIKDIAFTSIFFRRTFIKGSMEPDEQFTAKDFDGYCRTLLESTVQTMS